MILHPRQVEFVAALTRVGCAMYSCVALVSARQPFLSPARRCV